MKIIIFLMLILCSGCLPQAAIKGYEDATLQTVRAVEDNNIALWTVNACGTPLSAIIRHPNLVPALQALCLPEGQTSPSVMLEKAKK